VIGCLPFIDGETTFMIGPAVEIDPGYPAALDTVLETPSRMVSVTTVEGDTLLSESIGGRATRVRVWSNREREPEEVRIGLG
jgi:hypothetical protein